MQVQALIKYIRMSPKKLRDITKVIQGKPVSEALDLLRFIPRKSAFLVRKALQSAMANAENNNNFSSDHLYISRALVEEAPRIKRFRPAARGSAHPYQKRMSHVRIVLEEHAKFKKLNSN